MWGEIRVQFEIYLPEFRERIRYLSIEWTENNGDLVWACVCSSEQGDDKFLCEWEYKFIVGELSFVWL